MGMESPRLKPTFERVRALKVMLFSSNLLFAPLIRLKYVLIFQTRRFQASVCCTASQ